jgi:hypothetical protein
MEELSWQGWQFPGVTPYHSIGFVLDLGLTFVRVWVTLTGYDN